MRARDRALGIFLGILLGLAIVVAFVFFGSQGTIDAPSVDQGGPQQQVTVPEKAPKPGRQSRSTTPP